MQAKFERVSAAVKGYLTRRLMQTHKVQSIIQTIRVSAIFFSLSSPVIVEISNNAYVLS